MRFNVRVSLLALLTGVLLIAAVAPGAAQASFGIENFFAANCKEGFEECHRTVGESKEEERKNAEKEGYTQAAGHPPAGVTDFTVNTECVREGKGKCEKVVNPFTKKEEELLIPSGAAQGGIVEHVRTDVAPGISTDPFAVAQCSEEGFGVQIPKTPFFFPPTCSKGGPTNTVLGENKVVVLLAEENGTPLFDVPLHGTVYNLIPAEGLASEFGVALEIPAPLAEALSKGAIKATVYAHTLIKGSVEWGKEAKGTEQADYHDYFDIDVSTSLPLISSRLVFNGMLNPLEKGAFITNGSRCPGAHTSTLTLTAANHEVARQAYETPIGTAGCTPVEKGFKLVPFAPGFTLEQSNEAPDSPDGLTTEVKVPHTSTFEKEEEARQNADSSTVENVSIALPSGLTLNSAAAAGLEACTPAEIGLKVDASGKCPEGSKLGTVTIETPNLPVGSLKGAIYLGKQQGKESEPIEGSPFVIYLDARSKRYGVEVKVEGKTVANEKTGQLTTTFEKNPEQPFSDVILNFNGGPFAPLANGLGCEKGEVEISLTPYTGTETKLVKAPFTIEGCPATAPFALTQSTENETGNGGGHTAYTLSMNRKGGEQYLEKIKTTLPEGLLGAIPTVTPCEGPAAEAGTCAEASRIGTATVTAGAGGIPATFKGPVYFTGPYNNAPYGLSIVVPAAAGPFNLGLVVTRATINVDPITSRVTAESTVRSIFKGVPLRIRSISVAINKQGYLFNPTNCNKEQTETTLTSLNGAAVQTGLSSPFQLVNCSALSFGPAFNAATSAKFSKNNGAQLTTTLTQPSDQANIKSVKVQLPVQLPSRQTTLNQACLAATFEISPAACPAASKVGSAKVVTPTLPGAMEGPAYLVSHGGAKFPDLDLVVQDKGVKIILVGNTDIKNGITTTTFASTPDAPVSSVTVTLPSGPNSLLGANGDLCRRPLVMPTTMTGQNGKVTKQNTIISISGCGVKVVGHKVAGNTAILTVQVFGAGRISGGGRGLRTVRKSVSKAGTTSLKIPLSGGRGRPFKTTIRVGFVPKAKGAHSTASVTVTFR